MTKYDLLTYYFSGAILTTIVCLLAGAALDAIHQKDHIIKVWIALATLYMIIPIIICIILSSQ